jgi:hypothetical protein
MLHPIFMDNMTLKHTVSGKFLFGIFLWVIMQLTSLHAHHHPHGGFGQGRPGVRCKGPLQYSQGWFQPSRKWKYGCGQKRLEIYFGKGLFRQHQG